MPVRRLRALYSLSAFDKVRRSGIPWRVWYLFHHIVFSFSFIPPWITFFHIYLLCVCVYVHDVVSMCGAQRRACWNRFTQVVKVSAKHHYLLSHLASPDGFQCWYNCICRLAYWWWYPPPLKLTCTAKLCLDPLPSVLIGILAQFSVVSDQVQFGIILNSPSYAVITVICFRTLRHL